MAGDGKSTHAWKEDLKPPDCKVYIDLAQQRFKVHHLGFPGVVRSYAWTRRGVASVVALALQQMWSWEQQLHGADCPLPPELLQLAD